MDENPYLSPQSGRPITRTLPRLTVGKVVFIILGLILLGLGCFAIVAVNQTSRLRFNIRYTMSAGGTFLTVLGALSIAHGLLRKQSTVKWLIFVLISFMIFFALARVLIPW